jgi:hypothetical protein
VKSWLKEERSRRKDRGGRKKESGGGMSSFEPKRLKRGF